MRNNISTNNHTLLPVALLMTLMVVTAIQEEPTIALVTVMTQKH